MVSLNAEILADVVVQTDIVHLKIPNLVTRVFRMSCYIHEQMAHWTTSEFLLINKTANSLDFVK